MSETTLTEFLEGAGASLRILDMGRRVVKVGRNAFLKFEQTVNPWPAPLVRQAWFGMLMQNNELPEPLIWFLRLPLDEQGKLVLASRDYFIHRLIEAWQLKQQNESGEITDALKDNPYVFKPREDRMAVFHAKASVMMKQKPSRFYEHAQTYFNGEHGWEQWSFVGYQGIADVACRHAADPLDTAIPNLPVQPLVALCHCLESQVIGESLRSALCTRLTDTLRDRPEEIGTLAALVRALASRSTTEAVQQVLRTLLTTPSGRNIEVLAAISGRAWEALDDRTTRYAYLAALANNDHGQAAFARCISDLLSVPAVAQSVREALRADDQDTAVRAAFAAMTTAPASTRD